MGSFGLVWTYGKKSGSITKSTKDQVAAMRAAVVAKETHTRRSIVAVMQSWNIAASTFSDEFALYAALETEDRNQPDCIVIDAYMLHHTVVEIAQNIAFKSTWQPGIVVLSGIARSLPEAMNVVSLEKPYEPAKLLAAIRAVVAE